MIWRRYIVVISSIVLLACGVRFALACADGGSVFNNFMSFFQNNITGQPQYRMFYFTDMNTFYGDNNDYVMPEEEHPVVDENVEEWYSYCKTTATKADIDSLLNRFKESDIIALKKPGLRPTPKVANNTFSRFITLTNQSDVYDYLLFAKKCEPLNAAPDSYWDEAERTWKEPEPNSKSFLRLIQEGGVLYLKCNNDFLKWRYTYQVIRLAYHNRNYALTEQLYNKMIGNKTAASLMYYKCLGLKAGVLYHTGRKKQAAYLYSVVYDHLEDDYLSFSWCMDSVKISDILPLCKNDHERAVLNIMDGLHESSGQAYEGLNQLQSAWKFDPNVKGLTTVMTREINKAELRFFEKRESMERDLLRRQFRYYADEEYIQKEEQAWKETKAKYSTYLNGLNQFAQKVATDKRTAQRAFWYLSSAYIYYLQDKIDDCRKYMALAETAKMNTHEHDVHDIINVLCIASRSSTIDRETEAQLLPRLKWLESRGEGNIRFQKVYQDLLSQILTNKYLAQKDTIKAIYCLGRSVKSDNGGFYIAGDFSDAAGSILENMSIAKLRETERFDARNDKSEFEKWLTAGNAYNADMLLEYEGTKYIRQLNFGSAVEVFKKVSAGQLSRFVLPDVLVSHLTDYVTWNASDSANTYNKLTFSEKMVDLEKTLAKEPTNSRAAYQYANALYSMSYYGKGCHAYSYKYGTGDDNAYYDEPGRNKLDANSREYYSVSRAMKYYLIATDNSPDPEVQARCLFLASKCWQKSCPVLKPQTNTSSAEVEDYYLYSKKSPYFARLKNDFSNTAFYKKASTTCSYFRDYVKKN